MKWVPVPWPVVLVAFLLVGWVVNGVVSVHWSNAELYPFTAFPMFSGGVEETTRTHYLVTEDGEEVAIARAYHPERSLPLSVDSRILTNLRSSYENSCNGYQKPPYDNCPGEAEANWTMPPDLASTWGDMVAERVDSTIELDWLDLVVVEILVAEDVELERSLLFRFDPETGSTWLPGGPA